MDLQWKTTADDRAYWRRTSRMGVANLEWRQITMVAEERGWRKNREHDNDTAVCATCVVEYVDQQLASTATNALMEHKTC